MKLIVAATALVLATATGHALASPITSASDPALSGSTLVDFESETVGVYYAYQGGYTTTVGHVNFLGPRVYVDANTAIAGNYNTTGARYLTNGSATKVFSINFPSPVSAFGFNFGASDITWTMTAYDAAGNVVETMAIPATRGSNSGNYFGLSAPGIASVYLQQGAGLRLTDLVYLDNLRFR